MYNLDPLSPVKDAIVCTLLSAGGGGVGGVGWAGLNLQPNFQKGSSAWQDLNF